MLALVLVIACGIVLAFVMIGGLRLLFSRQVGWLLLIGFAVLVLGGYGGH